MQKKTTPIAGDRKKWYEQPGICVRAKNPFVIDGKEVTMLMTGGRTVTIDIGDFPLAAQYRWSSDCGYPQTAIRVDGRQVKMRLHRLLLDAPDGKVVDHRDGDPGNCRRTNLRICTQRENVYNTRRTSQNTTGWKGVQRHKASATYFVQIKMRGIQHRVGKFDTPEEAARGYDFLARSFFGQFARLNFQDNEEEPPANAE